MPLSRTPLLTAALLASPRLLAGSAFGAGKEIFTLTDPRGDDHGDGNILYPLGENLQSGDLDLLSLTARADGDGTMFEATFAKPVRVPGREAIDDLGTQLDKAARFGFYNLNLDIYIDTDRVPGSGGVTMLPGRHAEIDPATAWEKAVILTPRPNEAKAELKRLLLKTLNEDTKKPTSTLNDAEVEALRKQIPADVDERIFFPTQIHVRGQKISFFVPGIFLGGPAKPTWAYVVATSGADLVQSLDIAHMLGAPERRQVADDPPRLPRPLAGPLRRRPRERRPPAAADRHHRPQGEEPGEDPLRLRRPRAAPGGAHRRGAGRTEIERGSPPF